MKKKLLMAATVFTVAAAAQCRVSQQKGDSELGLFTGAVIPPGGGDVKMGGGANYAYAINKYLYPYGEFSVLPGGLNSTVEAGNSRFTSRGNLADFHGGLHVRLPISDCIVPYGVFAVGGIRSYSGTLDEINNQTNKIISSSPIESQTQFAVNYGAGIRYYITNKIGVRLEVKAYGPTNKFGGTPVRVMGGVFFQFKRK